MTEGGRPRIGIVGLGGRGRAHAEHLAELDTGIVAGADVAQDARDAFGADYDAATYPNAATMCEQATLDGVVITTPNKFHEEATLAALDAGLDVLCEKPLAHTLASAETIAEAARDAPGFCTVGFHSRFENAARVLRDAADAGDLGELRHVEASYVRRRGIPGMGGWFTRESLAGGGALIDVGVHLLDLSLHFLGFPEVVEVTGVTRADFGGDEYNYLSMWGEPSEDRHFDVDDSVTALVRTAAGQTITLNAAWAANAAPRERLELWGTDAGAELDLREDDVTLYETRGGAADHHVDSTIEVEPNSAYTDEMAAFLRAVETGEPPAWNTVEEALAVQRVVDAIYRSAEEGRAVSVEEWLPPSHRTASAARMD